MAGGVFRCEGYSVCVVLSSDAVLLSVCLLLSQKEGCFHRNLLLLFSFPVPASTEAFALTTFTFFFHLR